MPKFSRDKGNRGERDAVNRFVSWGVPAKRNLSQTRDGGHDIDLFYRGPEEAPLIGEVKTKAKLPIGSMRGWLGENDFLVLQETGKARLYVLTEPMLRELMER